MSLKCGTSKRAAVFISIWQDVGVQSVPTRNGPDGGPFFSRLFDFILFIFVRTRSFCWPVRVRVAVFRTGAMNGRSADKRPR